MTVTEGAGGASPKEGAGGDDVSNEALMSDYVAGASPHLDCVFLYKRNLERLSRNREELAREIRTTVLHETGHFFGLDEAELEGAGLG